GRGSLASLSASWGKLAEAARAGTLTRASVQGPLGATWLALGRIGWTMTAAWALQTGPGETLSMLRDALVDGIQRWQCRRLVAHLPEGQGETLWPRTVRAVAHRARPAAELGAIRAVWAGGHFTNAWRYARGHADSDMCQACGGAKDTLMHRWCVCPALVVPQGEELEHEEPFRKPIAGMRHQLEEAEQKWTSGDSELPLSYGLPLLSAMPPPVPSDNVVFEWGAAQEGWPSVVYTDGSACPVPLVQAGSVQVIVSDRQALVTEGSDWSSTAQSARARRASIWRQLHAAAARRGGPPPRLRWVPARRSLQQALGAGLRPLDWLGNCWADFFANLGAGEARLPNNAVEALQAELQRALDTAAFLGWAAARICRLGLWGPLGEDGGLQRRQVLGGPAAPKLSLAWHEYQVISSCGVQCVHCGRGACAAMARALLDCRPCQPTELGRVRARCSQGRPLASSAAVSASLQAAERELLPVSGARTTAEGNWAALGMLASSWIVDLMDRSLACASWMEECAECVYRLLGEEVYRGFFARNSDEMRSAERLRRAEEFCERGWRDGGPFREAHIDEAPQLEGEARQAKLQRLRGYHAAARAFLCDRGSARRAGGRRGPLYFTFFEPVGGARGGGSGGWRQGCAPRRRGRSRSRTNSRTIQSQGRAGGRAEPQRPVLPRPRGDAEGPQRPVGPRAVPAQRRRRSAEQSASRSRSPQARGQPAAHNEAERNDGPDPDAAIGLGVLRSMLRAFAGCWAFDLRDPEAAEDSWMAWAAQCALACLARPDNEDARAVAARRAGSMRLRALVQAMVRQAWLLKADARRIAVGRLMSLETLEEWLHVAALQWATLGDVCCAVGGVIGEAGANLPALLGFAGALPGLGPAGSSEQPSRQAGLPRPQGLRGRGIEALRRPWPGTSHSPQLPMVSAMQGGPDALGRDSDGEGDWLHPEAAPSGLPPPPPAAAAGQAPPPQPEGADQGLRGDAVAVG
ncbi:unnamed protein product, partial [Prorocentrum cordatum]